MSSRRTTRMLTSMKYRKYMMSEPEKMARSKMERLQGVHVGSQRKHGRSWKGTGTFLGQEGERR